MGTKITCSGLVRRKADEGKPVFAVLASGGIQHIGFTSAGYRLYQVPADAVALAYPLLGNRDGYICIHEAVDGVPQRQVVSTWEHKGKFTEALAEALGVPAGSEAVVELAKRVSRFIR